MSFKGLWLLFDLPHGALQTNGIVMLEPPEAETDMGTGNRSSIIQHKKLFCGPIALRDFPSDIGFGLKQGGWLSILKIMSILL